MSDEDEGERLDLEALRAALRGEHREPEVGYEEHMRKVGRFVAGRSTEPPDRDERLRFGAWKAYAMLIGRESDIAIDEGSLRFRQSGGRARGDVLAAELAPGVVARLLDHAGLARVAGPVVVRPPDREVRWPPSGEAAATRDLVMWFRPRSDGLDVATRVRPEVSLDGPVPIPDDGPLAWPEPLRPPAPRFVELDSSLACPRCRSVARRYRRAGFDALVCSACGRSFVPDAGLLSD